MTEFGGPLLQNINKILIIRFSSFGDIVLSFPLLNTLKKNFPDAQLDFVTKAQYKELVELHPFVNKIIPYNNEPLLKFRRNLNINKYDIVLDLHKNIRSYVITFFLSKKVFRYYKETVKKLILVIFKINLFKNIIPVYSKYLSALHRILQNKKIFYSSSELLIDSPRIVNEEYIVISPSSRHFTKTLPKEKFSEIVKTVQNKIIVFIGDDTEKDKNICNYLTGAAGNIVNLCGKTNFKNLANLLYFADLVVCNDSGVLHLAESLQKKVICFFGSTVKEFGFYPQLDTTEVIENLNLKCRPCTHIGKSHCPKKHFKCMKDLKVENINLKI